MRVVLAMDHRPGAIAHAALRSAYYVFLVAGITALGYAGYAVLDLYWFQSTELTSIEMERRAPAPPPAPNVIPAPPAIGDVIGDLEVPRLGLRAAIVEGDSGRLLRHAVGHLPETALPGEAGNVALAGHRDGLFRPLRNIQPGDSIVLKTRDREFQYQVEWTAVVPPSATEVVEPTAEPSLTLVTCFPFYYVGTAPKRFIVRARPTWPVAGDSGVAGSADSAASSGSESHSGVVR